MSLTKYKQSSLKDKYSNEDLENEVVKLNEDTKTVKEKVAKKKTK